jgi:hypothetical protein
MTWHLAEELCSGHSSRTVARLETQWCHQVRVPDKTYNTWEWNMGNDVCLVCVALKKQCFPHWEFHIKIAPPTTIASTRRRQVVQVWEMVIDLTTYQACYETYSSTIHCSKPIQNVFSVMISRDQHFRASYCLHLQGENIAGHPLPKRPPWKPLDQN